MAKEHSVTFEQAMRLGVALAAQQPHTEWVSVFQALGRTLGEDVTCKKNLPSFNNAAMDGFAFKFEFSLEKLKIKKTIFAGDVVEASLKEDECYKIMTGAKVPEDADTIIPFEDCVRYDEHSVTLPALIKQGNALRLKGEEARVGSVLLYAGERIGSREIAVLASQGISTVCVYKKLRIAVFSTGNELKLPWENAGEDEIYDINALSLISLLNEHGFEASYCGVIPDNLEAATSYFALMKQYDVLVTSGGVSMGEADFVEQALRANGFDATFNGINIKPGKPTMMGKMDHTIVASMPGNPLAAYVNAFVFLLPLLKKLQGQKVFHHPIVEAKNIVPFKVRPGRVNLVLGCFIDGHFEVYGANKYGSGMVRPLQQSNALWISSETDGGVDAGMTIKILLF
jgi:molybdopterin molybdotransferase